MLAGAGAHRSTGRDMMVFLRACLADDTKPVTRAIRLSQKKRHTMEDGRAIGLGWHLHPDGITWWHNGGTGGYSSWLSVVPSKKAGVVVLANTSTPKTDELGVDADAAGVRHRRAGGRRGRKRGVKEVEVDPKVLETYTGYFAHHAGIRADGDARGRQADGAGYGPGEDSGRRGGERRSSIASWSTRTFSSCRTMRAK